jgi:hypothetical protein
LALIPMNVIQKLSATMLSNPTTLTEGRRD